MNLPVIQQQQTTTTPIDVTVAARADIERVARYAPNLSPQLWDEIGPFVREAVAEASVDLGQPVRELLNAFRAITVWAHTAGHPLDRDVVLDRFVIEEFIAAAHAQYKPATRNALRAALFRMSEVLCGTESTIPRFAPIGSPKGSEPYTSSEIVSLRTLTQHRRVTPAELTVRLFVALGLGAGLDAEDIKPLHIEHIQAADGVFFIDVPPGRRPERTAVVGDDYADPLAAVLSVLPDHGPILGVTGLTVTARRVSSLSTAVAGDVPFSPRRLRSTWIVQQLTAGTPLSTVLTAGGLTSLTSLDRLLCYVDKPDPLIALSHLTGRSVR